MRKKCLYRKQRVTKSVHNTPLTVIILQKVPLVQNFVVSPSSTKEQLIQGRIKIQKGKNNTEETKNSQLNYLVELYDIWV